jgi:putative transposase
LILGVRVTPASVQDRDGAKALLSSLKARLPRFTHLWADGSYAGELVTWVRETLGWTLEVVSKPKDQKGFVVLPRRWVVERTLAWCGKYRQLSKDYAAGTTGSETLIYIAMTHRMLRQLRPARAP